jgi:hypothetical protein
MKGVKKRTTFGVAAFECVSVLGERGLHIHKHTHKHTHTHTHMCLTTAHISDGVDDGCASIGFHEDEQSAWS